MFRTGRRADPVRAHFQKVESDGKTAAKCKLCGNHQAPIPDRMRKHHEKCSNAFKTGRQTERLSATNIATSPQKRSRSKSPPQKRMAVEPCVFAQDPMDNYDLCN